MRIEDIRSTEMLIEKTISRIKKHTMETYLQETLLNALELKLREQKLMYNCEKIGDGENCILI